MMLTSPQAGSPDDPGDPIGHPGRTAFDPLGGSGPGADDGGDAFDDEVDVAAFHLVWEETTVQDRPAVYGSAGEGRTVVFLHGWGLDHKAYKRALRRLVQRGLRVVAPAMPGFGGSANLPRDRCTIEGYAAWVDDLLEVVGVGSGVVAMGHSFGGGVAIVLAHRYPRRVGGLVLINSIGSSAWTGSGSTIRSMAQRPLWDWGVHFPGDLWPLGQARKVLPVILAEAVPNLARDPRSFFRVAGMARRADLTDELEDLKRRRLPVLVLWGSRDRIITRTAFEEMCRVLGGPRALTVEGTHAWLIADPDALGEVMTNVVEIAEQAQTLSGRQRTARPRRARAGR